MTRFILVTPENVLAYIANVNDRYGLVTFIYFRCRDNTSKHHYTAISGRIGVLRRNSAGIGENENPFYCLIIKESPPLEQGERQEQEMSIRATVAISRCSGPRFHPRGSLPRLPRRREGPRSSPGGITPEGAPIRPGSREALRRFRGDPSCIPRRWCLRPPPG